MNQEPLTWVSVGQFIAITVSTLAALLAGAIVVWRPLFDLAVLRAVQRRRPDIERMLREEVFKRELDEREATRKLIESAALTSERNAEAIDALRKGHEAIDRELRALPALAQSVERCTDAVEKLTGDLNAASGRLERFGGILDQLRHE